MKRVTILFSIFMAIIVFASINSVQAQKEYDFKAKAGMNIAKLFFNYCLT